MKKLLFLICASMSTMNLAQAQTLRFFEFDFHMAYPDSLNMFAATSDAIVLHDVDSQLTLPVADRAKHINGNIQGGTPPNNPLYSWHFITNQWTLGDFSIEACDGRPLEDVEADTTYWIHTLGEFCPWTSYVKQEIFPTGLNEPVEDVQFLVYPNPCIHLVELYNASVYPILDVSIINASGEIIATYSQPILPGEKYRHSFNELSAGVYFLVCKIPHTYVIKKIVKD